MGILSRHVFAQLMLIYLLALTGLTGMMLIGGVAREALQQSLPPAQVALIIPYLLPEILRITLPVTLLFAATTVYARMSGSNEVVALKALGISPMVILYPVLVIGVLMSLVTVWLNDLAVSWSRPGISRVALEAVDEIAYSILRKQRRYATSSFQINVTRVDGQRLISPAITLSDSGDGPSLTVTADEAWLISDPSRDVLRIVTKNAIFHADDGGVTARLPHYEREIPLEDARKRKRVSGHPSTLSLRVIPEETTRQKQEIERTENHLATLAAYQMLTGDCQGLLGSEYREEQYLLDNKWKRWHRLCTEPPRRWAAGFSCLCFVFVGGPMALRLRNTAPLTSFFFCFLPILIAYYPLMIFGVDGAKNGTIPPMAVWGGNVLLMVWGAWLLRKLLRY